MNRFRLLPLFALGLLLHATTAQAQYELKAGNFNAISQGALPVGGNQATQPQNPANSNFRAVGAVTGSSSAIDLSPNDVWPAAAVPAAHAVLYPADTATAHTVTVVLTRSTIGGGFASGVPRYSLGDVITPPLVQADGVTPAPAGYWRARPVGPGELVAPFYSVGGGLQPGGTTPIPTANVNVTSSNTGTTTGTLVTVAATVPELVVGATLLGQPITDVTELNVTLAGPANEVINSSTARPISPALTYYYSPHAEKVYASQPGRVNVLWVTLTPTANGGYETLSETFAVSSNTSLPVRTIYWTEGSFDGPKVQITDGRITTVNPAYYKTVPKAVAQEVSIPGYTPTAPNLTTLSFDKYNGTGLLHAYNVEGRIFVEYLGNVRLAPNVFDQVGFDVVELVRVPASNRTIVNLGQELRPHDGSTDLTASPVINAQQAGTGSYGSLLRADGSTGYYAERETSPANNPDNGEPASVDAYNKVVFYWLETGSFGIQWPKFQDRYWQRWSPVLADYAHYTVDPTGSTADTGVGFTGGSLPELVYQDDPAQTEAQIDSATQRLIVDLSASTDAFNRSLLKFTSSSSVWYVNLYTQAEDRVLTIENAVFSNADVETVVTVDSTVGMTPGMRINSFSNLYVDHIIDDTRYVPTGFVYDGTYDWHYGTSVSRSAAIRTPSSHVYTIPNTAGLENDGYFDFNDGIDPSLPPDFYGGGFVTVLNATQYVAAGNPTDLPWVASGTYTIRTFFENFSIDVNIATQVETTPTGPTTLQRTAGSTFTNGDLFPGMTVTGPGINGSTKIVSITDSNNLVLEQPTADYYYNRSYSFINRRSSTATNTYVNPTVVTVPSTSGLEVGMVLTGLSGTVTIARILNGTQFEISSNVPNLTTDLSFTVESDAQQPIIDAVATVGTRLQPPAGHELAGYIDSGTGYYPEGYLNPFVVGVEAANQGAIIPVNALPDDRELNVRWFKKVPAPSADFQDLYVPGKIGRYTVSYPASTTPQIVIAEGVGTDDLSPAEAAGIVYTQNNPALPGYNPNEEHAFPLGGRVYALREDLNAKYFFLHAAGWDSTLQVDDTSILSVGMTVIMPGDAGEATVVEILSDIWVELSQPVPGDGDYVFTTGEYTSDPFVLIAYTDPVDGRPAMHAYKVVREDEDYAFDFTATAGTLLVKPYPLPLMPLAMVGTGVNRTAKDLEIIPVPDVPNNGTVATDPAYERFTFKDRKGFSWVHRGPHDGGSPELQMKLYYLSRAGFFVPGTGEIPENTIMPFLRPAARSGQTLNLASIDNGQADEPLTIVYRPEWPTDAPELRVAETLTLPKFGLPQVRGQASAQVIYQQSIANAFTGTGLTKNSVTLHDPTREKVIALDAAGIGLDGLPSALKTTTYQGKTYFQGLPAHLQTRLYYNPLRGDKGSLVLIGEFHDEIAGEDYLDLNLLTVAEEQAIKDLMPNGATGEAGWDKAIDELKTRVNTYKSDPAQFGSYIVESFDTFYGDELAVINSPETAQDSYAVTATGQGTGYVTMVFGNSINTERQPEGDPVVVQVFKIADQLYVGDLKVITSSNPLDEQVTLRHSGDFAGKPENYDFEWRWATGEASAPATYATVMTNRIGDPAATPSPTDKWVIVSDPGALKPTAAQYTAAGAAVALGSRNVRPVNYVLDAQNQPTSTVIEETSYTDAEIAAGYPSLVAKSELGVDFTGGVPGRVVFSAGLGTQDGIVLYVNDKVAVAYNAPTPQFALTNASSGLTDAGKSSAGGNDSLKQFDIAPSYFSASANKIEIAIYTGADPNAVSALQVLLEAAQETDLVTTGTTWQTASDPTGKNTNMALVGGSTSNPFGGPQFVLNDRWFTMRYKTKFGTNNVLGDNVYSRWMPPQFVPGWIKRVLDAINPFEQRVKDLYNNSVNTDVSVLTQAGTRWEGDIALTMDNIDDVGLIAIYETVLNRGKNMSINANTNDPDTNNALTLAAGYLNDLYTILGNEAYADAANPTISLDDQDTITEVNTSRFAFESQVASSLDEELALLKGRDDFTTRIDVAPAYNRLYWNYTQGINSGEVIYAVNYNVKEKVGSSTADGIIDAADAQRMFPQAHGDAYGHYLTALTGYYQLLTNPNFTWTPRAEAVLVLGQPVTVDFQDERKFAAAAGNTARTAQQVVALTFRQNYEDDPAQGWGSYTDTKGTNTSTGVTRHQGLDEWTSRSTQGAYLNWVVGNALVPDVDTYHEEGSIQKIDRSNVPELQQLASIGESFQTTIDNANAHLNPLGLSPGAIAFDISPLEMQAGNSHFEQVYERSLRSLLNASGAFNQAGRMTRSLRNQQNQIDDYTSVIEQQEIAYVNQLVDIYGTPYSGEIGAGKLYAQGYDGPDLEHWFIVDRPNDLVDTSQTFAVTIQEANGINNFTGQAINDVVKAKTSPLLVSKTVTVHPSQWVQYNDVWKTGGLGSRAETGDLQDALQDAQQSYLALSEARVRYLQHDADLTNAQTMLQAFVQSQINAEATTDKARKSIAISKGIATTLKQASKNKVILADGAIWLGNALAEAFPKVAGLATDVTSAGRSAAKFTSKTLWISLQVAGAVAEAAAAAANLNASIELTELEDAVREAEFDREAIQLAYEVNLMYREAVTHANELMQLALAHQRALQNVQNVLAEGDRILLQREVFRQRAAAIIQGYRTKDLAFRIFRNEALEQYRSLFDLASRYTYLAAKSYDYETGLLGSTQGQGVFEKIVAARSLGDLTDGVPQATVSTLGDAGLAGTMAQMNADFSVAEGRLGINNPDQYGTVFSLRQELFRILHLPGITSDDDAWQQTLEQHIHSNLLADSDVATQCRNLKKPDGSPVPGFIIPFSTSIQHGRNFFGLQLAGGDHNFSATSFATKIFSVGIALPGYVGMDPYATGVPIGATPPPDNTDPNVLSATPYLYLIPCGNDYMLAPPLGDTNTLRSWTVHDQALPLPYNLGATAFNSTQFFNANGTLSEQPWILRKHQSFRAVSDATFFYSFLPEEFSNMRLIGRSVWNSQWKIVIPAYSLLYNEQEALNRFTATVKDIQLFLRTYSHSGN